MKEEQDTIWDTLRRVRNGLIVILVETICALVSVSYANDYLRHSNLLGYLWMLGTLICWFSIMVAVLVRLDRGPRTWR